MLHRRDVQRRAVSSLKHSRRSGERPNRASLRVRFDPAEGRFFRDLQHFFEIKFLPTVTTLELFSTFFQWNTASLTRIAQNILVLEQTLYQLQNRHLEQRQTQLPI